MLLQLLLIRIGKVAFVAVDALEAAGQVRQAKLAATFSFLHRFKIDRLIDEGTHDELYTFIPDVVVRDVQQLDVIVGPQQTRYAFRVLVGQLIVR